MPGITSVQISLLAERGVVEYDGDYVNEYGEGWTEKKIADEIEDVGFDAEIVEKSEIVSVELRVYGYVSASVERGFGLTMLGWKMQILSTLSS
jgi:Cu+-exporting ATPase